jgi:hypothetical protein
LERGLWAYPACDCLIFGYDKRLYQQRDLITRWRTWRRIQNRLLSVAARAVKTRAAGYERQDCFSREGRPPYGPTNHSWPGCHRARNPRTGRRSLLGGAGCYTLKMSKVSRVARSPFPFSIYFVPNNFTTLVVKGWGFQLGRIGSCFRRGRHRSRGRRWGGRSRRYLWLWGDPSRQSPVSDRRNRESELHGAVGSFSTSQNLHPIIS